MGADMVEIDVAPTADGQMAVFHDWTVDCRTEGKGNVRDKTMAELKQLDPGYGYTADGGKTFPLRGSQTRLNPKPAGGAAGGGIDAPDVQLQEQGSRGSRSAGRASWRRRGAIR